MRTCWWGGVYFFNRATMSLSVTGGTSVLRRPVATTAMPSATAATAGAVGAERRGGGGDPPPAPGGGGGERGGGQEGEPGTGGEEVGGKQEGPRGAEGGDRACEEDAEKDDGGGGWEPPIDPQRDQKGGRDEPVERVGRGAVPVAEDVAGEVRDGGPLTREGSDGVPAGLAEDSGVEEQAEHGCRGEGDRERQGDPTAVAQHHP